MRFVHAEGEEQRALEAPPAGRVAEAGRVPAALREQPALGLCPGDFEPRQRQAARGRAALRQRLALIGIEPARRPRAELRLRLLRLERARARPRGGVNLSHAELAAERHRVRVAVQQLFRTALGETAVGLYREILDELSPNQEGLHAPLLRDAQLETLADHPAFVPDADGQPL